MLIMMLIVYLLQTIMNIVLCRREPLQRFIVEEGIKPPIFGSYSYDPLRQVFDPPTPDNNDTVPSQFYNQSYVLSTAIGEELTTPTVITTKNSSVYFRKHVTYNMETTPWWARPKKFHMNSTMKHRHT